MKYILNNDNFEVVGKQYLNGVGNYDGTNPDSYNDIATVLPNLVEVTYKQLKDLRDNHRLVPGQQYRITDYVTTTSARNTRSAGNQFDIIVTALDKKTLSEEARAIKSETAPDSYFNDVNFSAWKIWYSLDNDVERFAWADSENGKGVIYRMIDEWGNDCSYDFKNIMFTRYELNIPDEYIAENIEKKWLEILSNNIRNKFNEGSLSYIWSGIDESEKYWEDFYGILYSTTTGKTKDFYTFSDLSGDAVIDASLGGNTNDNLMGVNYTELPNNVVFGDYCYYNTFGDGCHDNTFGNYCYYNTFGDGCYYNTFGNYCNYNTFGDGCYSNIFGNNCCSNTFGGGCDSNTFGNEGISNTIGAEGYSNTFGNSCISNTFGDGCYSNTFGDGCNSNTIGDGCNYNTFGNECISNTFGNVCISNTFGNVCYFNTFGNVCESNTFGDGCGSNTFDNSCVYNTFGNNCSSNTFGDVCYGNTFGDECEKNTFGKECHDNLLGNTTSYNNFGDCCYVNKLNGSCCKNTFGNNCNNNGGTSTARCNYNVFGNNCSNNTFQHEFSHNILCDGFSSNADLGYGISYRKYGDNSVVYAVCTSNADDNTKEITITNKLYDGLKILINFINGNTYFQDNLDTTIDSFSMVKVSNYEGEQYCYLYFNGTKNEIKRPDMPSLGLYEYTVTYTKTPLFDPGVYEFVYKEEDGGLHFTGSHTAEKDPYIYISNTPDYIQQYKTIIYLPKTIHTVIGDTIGDSGESDGSDGSGMSPVFTLKGDVTGDYSFEFKTGSDDIEFTTPSWKWANGIIPKLKADKTYHVSVKNGCAVIAEF